MKRRITIKQIMKMGPCYTKEQLEEIFKRHGFKRSASLEEIIKAEHKIEDKIWLLINLIPEREQHLFACWCAERALKHKRKAGHEPDKRSWDAVRAKRKWLDGKITDEELKIAYDAASAASDATHAAVYAAVYAAYYAAVAAAYAAAAYAYDAAGVAADAAANYVVADAAANYVVAVDYGAERKKQLNKLVRIIKSYE